MTSVAFLTMPQVKSLLKQVKNYVPFFTCDKLFRLTEEERRGLLPSGQQTIINNRVGWARTYMVKAYKYVRYDSVCEYCQAQD